MKELKRKGVSLILSTWPIRASVNKASAAFKCVGLFCRVGAPSGIWVDLLMVSVLNGKQLMMCAAWSLLR